jgi:hypothetical protein
MVPHHVLLAIEDVAKARSGLTNSRKKREDR